MIISDTSALVLNWTSKDIWKSKNAQQYFSGLDLSSADPLLKRYDERETFLHTQGMSNRKYFVRKCAVKFLEQYKTEHGWGQVIVLAAGIDALSVELASLYPESIVFDVDKYSMKEKEKYLGRLCPNIKFIECDITNTALLEKGLIENGWNPNQPGILIMEGITYYLSENELRKVLTFFASTTSAFVCDFGMTAECVNEHNRKYGVESFRKIVESVGLDFMISYEPDYYMALINQCGFKNAERFTMDYIQSERTGEATPFDGEDGWFVSMVTNVLL